MNKPLTMFIAPTISYWQFVWKIPANRFLVLGGLGASVLLFCIFKLFYPCPDFFSDSYNYIYAASNHLDINIWPIGYSKFLAGFHAVTWSDTALVALQYFAMQLAALHFLFTVLYFYHLQGWYRNALVLFLLINPLTLYLCNTINSDALFAALSLLWITELIWIVQKPRWYQLPVQALLLFLCFTIRNNAYYYPIVATIAVMLTRQSIWKKAVGITLPFAFIVPFILFTRQACFKLTGTRQFSLFTGWQLANNALYIYDQVDIDSSDLPTAEARTLNRYALQYFRSINLSEYRDELESYAGCFFIRQPEAPMKQYYASHSFYIGKNEDVVNWARTSEVFGPFGKAIILQHPISYVQYFILPNIKNYFIPPLSHIGLYNRGSDDVKTEAKDWFHYKTTKIRCVSHTFQGILLSIYVGFFLLVNIYYLLSVTRCGFTVIIQSDPIADVAIHLTILSFLALNFIFSIISTLNILRYQYIPMIVLLCFGLLLGHYRENLSPKQNKKPSNPNETKNLSHTIF